MRHAPYGHVSRCVVAKGTSPGSRSSGNAGNVYLANSAVMENCLVMGGVVNNNNADSANGVYLANNSRLVNCTIVKNRSDSYASVPAVKAGANTARVVNCAIYGNGGTAAREWGNANAASFYSCAFAAEADFTGAN